MDGEVAVVVVGYKHHWEVLETTTGQVRTSKMQIDIEEIFIVTHF